MAWYFGQTLQSEGFSTSVLYFEPGAYRALNISGWLGAKGLSGDAPYLVSRSDFTR